MEGRKEPVVRREGLNGKGTDGTWDPSIVTERAGVKEESRCQGKSRVKKRTGLKKHWPVKGWFWRGVSIWAPPPHRFKSRSKATNLGRQHRNRWCGRLREWRSACLLPRIATRQISSRSSDAVTRPSPVRRWCRQSREAVSCRHVGGADVNCGRVATKKGVWSVILPSF